MLDRIDGIRLIINLNGNALNVGEDGFIGNLKNQDKLKIEVKVENPSLFAINVDGTKNVTTKNPLDGSLRCFVLSPKILEDRNGVSYPNRATCEFRLGRLEGSVVCLAQIGVISQNGKFFLVIQDNQYVGQLYHCEGKVYVERLSQLEHSIQPWDQLSLYLTCNFPHETIAWPDLKDLESKSKNELDQIPENTGVVAWFNRVDGYGCLITNQGPAFVHWRNLSPRPRFAYLLEGERVRYDAVKKNESSSSTIPLKAFGVCPVEG